MKKLIDLFRIKKAPKMVKTEEVVSRITPSIHIIGKIDPTSCLRVPYINHIIKEKEKSGSCNDIIKAILKCNNTFGTDKIYFHMENDSKSLDEFTSSLCTRLPPEVPSETYNLYGKVTERSDISLTGYIYRYSMIVYNAINIVKDPLILSLIKSVNLNKSNIFDLVSRSRWTDWVSGYANYLMYYVEKNTSTVLTGVNSTEIDYTQPDNGFPTENVGVSMSSLELSIVTTDDNLMTAVSQLEENHIIDSSIKIVLLETDDYDRFTCFIDISIDDLSKVKLHLVNMVPEINKNDLKDIKSTLKNIDSILRTAGSLR